MSALEVTPQNVRALLAAPHKSPALYVQRYADDGQPLPGGPRLEVWAAAYVPGGDVLCTRSEAEDQLGARPDGDSLAWYAAEVLQPALDGLLGR